MSTVYALKQHQQGIDSQDTRLLQKSALLAGLEPSQQEALLACGRKISKKKGEFLFLDGSEIDSVYYVMAGKIREYFTNPDGGECLRRISSTGQYLLLRQLFDDNKVHEYSSDTITTTTLYCWRAKELKTMVSRVPALACSVGKILAADSEQLCRHLCLCRKSNAVSRVAGYLLSRHQAATKALSLSHSGKEISVNLKPIGISAGDICLARETFSRALSTLQQQELIRVSCGMAILTDIKGLKRLSSMADE